jgi:hypothetical protein
VVVALRSVYQLACNASKCRPASEVVPTGTIHAWQAVSRRHQVVIPAVEVFRQLSWRLASTKHDRHRCCFAFTLPASDWAQDRGIAAVIRAEVVHARMHSKLEREGLLSARRISILCFAGRAARRAGLGERPASMRHLRSDGQHSDSCTFYARKAAGR